MTRGTPEITMLQTLGELISLGSMLAAGLYAYRYMSPFFRIIFLQGVVWIFFYLLVHTLLIYQWIYGKTADSQWLINLAIVCETLLLMVAAWVYFREEWKKKLTLLLLFFFLLVLLVQGLTLGFSVYLHYADVAACIGITVLYTLLLYTFLTRPANPTTRIPQRYMPELLLSVGLLLYYAGSVPYVALIHYLEEDDPVWNDRLFYLINNVLAFLRYSLTAFAFLLLRRHTFSSIRNS